MHHSVQDCFSIAMDVNLLRLFFKLLFRRARASAACQVLTSTRRSTDWGIDIPVIKMADPCCYFMHLHVLAALFCRASFALKRRTSKHAKRKTYNISSPAFVCQRPIAYRSRRLQKLVGRIGLVGADDMAKKGGRSGLAEPSSSAVPSRDILQRLNYLYQVSVLLSTAIGARTNMAGEDIVGHALTGASAREEGKRTGDSKERNETEGVGMVAQAAGTSATKTQQSRRTRSRRTLLPSAGKESAAPVLARMMVKTMREVAKKAVVRMYVHLLLHFLLSYAIHGAIIYMYHGLKRAAASPCQGSNDQTNVVQRLLDSAGPRMDHFDSNQTSVRFLRRPYHLSLAMYRGEVRYSPSLRDHLSRRLRILFHTRPSLTSTRHFETPSYSLSRRKLTN